MPFIHDPCLQSDSSDSDDEGEHQSTVLNSLPVPKENRGKKWFKRGLFNYLKSQQSYGNTTIGDLDQMEYTGDAS